MDQEFSLDPVKTQLTAPITSVVAARGASNVAKNSGLSKGLASFGSALVNLGEVEKRQQIRQDVRTARNAAAKNEEMPGGLFPVAQQAYNDTVDVDTATKAIREIQTYLDGPESKAVLTDPSIPSNKKTFVFDSIIGGITEKAQQTISNPDVLLQLNQQVDELAFKRSKEVFAFERNQRDAHIQQTFHDQVIAGFDSGNAPSEIFTQEWLKSNAKTYSTAAPWRSEAESRIILFQLMTNTDGAKENPSLIENLLDTEVDDGISFRSLMDSPTGNGPIVRKIYQTHLTNSAKHFADMDTAEANAKLFQFEQGKEFTDAMIEQGPVDVQELRKTLRETYGLPFSQINTLVNVVDSAEKDTATSQGVGSEAYNKIFVDVLEGKIKFNSDILTSMDGNGVSGSHEEKLLKAALAKEDKQRTTSVQRLKNAGRPMLNSMASVMFAKDKGGVGAIVQEIMSSKGGEIDFESDELVRKMISKGVSDEKILAVQFKISQFRAAVDDVIVTLADKAARTDTPIDTREFLNTLKDEVGNIANVTAPADEQGPAKADEATEESEVIKPGETSGEMFGPNIPVDTIIKAQVGDPEAVKDMGTVLADSYTKQADAIIADLEQVVGETVDFWSEAASAAGAFLNKPLGEATQDTFDAVEKLVNTPIEPVQEFFNFLFSPSEDTPSESSSLDKIKKAKATEKITQMFNTSENLSGTFTKAVLAFISPSEANAGEVEQPVDHKMTLTAQPPKLKPEVPLPQPLHRTLALQEDPKVRESVFGKEGFNLKGQGITPDQFEKAFNMGARAVAQIESLNLEDQVQLPSGPGKGLFQFEAPSALTVYNRERVMQGKRPFKNAAEAIAAGKELDFSKLSRKEQIRLYQLDLSKRKGSTKAFAKLSKLIESGKGTTEQFLDVLTDIWAINKAAASSGNTLEQEKKKVKERLRNENFDHILKDNIFKPIAPSKKGDK